MTYRKSNAQRESKCKKSEQKTLVPVRFKLIQIELKSGNEHYIEKSYSRKKVNRRTALKYVKSVWSDYYSGNYQTYYSGNVNFSEQDG